MQREDLTNVDSISMDGDVANIRVLNVGGTVFMSPHKFVGSFTPGKRLDISGVFHGKDVKFICQNM
jgi:hypothetical protein